MRLDLYLKASRLIKRRSVAREMCESGRVFVNGHEAKPAKEIKEGDTLTLRFSSRIIELEVLGIPLSSKKTHHEELYTVKSETKVPKGEDLWSENPS